jgi:hypothetical protein
MRLLKRISPSLHGIVELSAGLSLIAGSLLLDIGTAGVLGVFTAGVVLAGMGLGAVESLPLGAHLALDRLVVTVTALVSIALALAGDVTAALVLLAVAAGLLVLDAVTRWTRPALHR